MLFMTSLCYLNDPWKAMAEARRVVRGHGRIIIGFVDRASPLGREYVERVRHDPFYQDARFYSAAEVKELLCQAGDGPLECFQTIFDDPGKMTAPDPAVEGHGKGLLAVMSIEPRSGIGE